MPRIGEHVVDEQLLRKLPLPLAQLYLRAIYGKSAIERNLAAYYLWESALRLLASTAIAEYAASPQRVPEIDEILQRNLLRPTLGHWWEFVQKIVPALAERGDTGYVSLRDFLLGSRRRNDMPRAAALNAAIHSLLDKPRISRANVQISELFSNLMQFRNEKIGHGAAGLDRDDVAESIGASMIAGVVELLGRCDVLAGRKLLFVESLTKEPQGHWEVYYHDLTGERATPFPPASFTDARHAGSIQTECLYVERPETEGAVGKNEVTLLDRLCCLDPFLVYDIKTNTVYFMQGCKERSRKDEKVRISKVKYHCLATNEIKPGGEFAPQHERALHKALGFDLQDRWDEPGDSTPSEGQQVAAGHSLRTIGEYELISRIGQGAMGTVYRARQPTLHREVALKTLTRIGDPIAEARFQREIRALGRVEHPNVIKVFTSEIDNGQWFYTMELVEGADLSAVCAQLTGKASNTISRADWLHALSSAADAARDSEEPLSDDAADRAPLRAMADSDPVEESPIGSSSHISFVTKIVQQVASAAHELHEHGVIHRDIKPSNIMVTFDRREAVLMDLGLAQFADEIDHDLTKTRQFLGTPQYASPEQVLAVDRLDRRTDVYSLGATLWELLTLRSMFGAHKDMPPGELYTRITRDDPEDPRKHNPKVPRDLAAIVLKCLRKEKKNRYPTALLLATDLGRFLRGETVEARTPSRRERAWRLVKRNPVVTGLLATIALTMVAGTIVATAFAIQSSREKRRAEHRLYQMRLMSGIREWEVGEVNKAWEHAERAGNYARRVHPGRASWELDYLCRLLNTDQRTLRLTSDQGQPTSIAFSPDGRHLAIGSSRYALTIWDVSSPDVQPVKSGRTKLGEITAVVFTEDGKRVLTGGGTGGACNLRAWEIDRVGENRYEGKLLTEHDSDIHSIAVCKGRVASADSDGTVKITDIATSNAGPPIKVGGRQACVEFRPQGDRLFVVNLKPVVNVIDCSQGKKSADLRCPKSETPNYECLAVSRNGQWVAAGTKSGQINVWKADSDEFFGTVDAHSPAVEFIEFGKEESVLAVGSSDGLIRIVQIMRIVDGKPIVDETVLATLRGHCKRIRQLAFSPDGTSIASASEDDTAKVWSWQNSGRSAEKAKLPIVAERDDPPIVSLSVGAEGTLVAGSEHRTSLVACRIENGRSEQEHSIPLKGDARVTCLACQDSEGGACVVAGMTDGSLRRWEGRDFELAKVFQAQIGKIQAIALSADRKQVAAVGNSGRTVVMVNLQNQKSSNVPIGDEQRAECIAFTTDGRQLLVGFLTKQLEIRDPATGEVMRTLQGHNNEINGLAVSPDGRWIASGDKDGAVILWDAANFSARTVRAGGKACNGVTFSGDSQRVIYCCVDRSIHVWDIDAEEESLELRGGDQSIRKVGCTKNGVLASIDTEGAVRIFDGRRPIPETADWCFLRKPREIKEIFEHR